MEAIKLQYTEVDDPEIKTMVIRERDGVDYDANCSICERPNAEFRAFYENGGMMDALCTRCMQGTVAFFLGD